MTEKIDAQHILVEHEYEANDILKNLVKAKSSIKWLQTFRSALPGKVVGISALLERE